MSETLVTARKYAILFHRWLGVFFCLLFAAWFVSGMVLMYCDFPAVSAQERLERAPVLTPALLKLSPTEALATLDPAERPTQVKLTSVDSRPVYRFQFGRTTLSVFGDSGELLDQVPRDMALRIASAWTGRTEGTAGARSVDEPDQWTVYPEIRRDRPYWKFNWPDGQEVYVSKSSGEVVQHTTRWSRIGAYAGAIPHWIYITALRKDTPAWRATIIWLSAVGAVMSLLGIVVGIWLYSPFQKRYRFPQGRSSVPYTGYKRWHEIFGLIFGLFTMTWILSGMFSMNPLSWSPDQAPEAPTKSLRAEKWEEQPFAGLHPRDVLRGSAYKELEMAVVLGHAAYFAKESPGRTTIIPIGANPVPELDSSEILRQITADATPYRIAESRRVTEYEPYYIDRHFKKPLPVLYVRLNDPQESIYYVDLKTARVVESYDFRSRWNRWLYHGLHSMDLPLLYKYRPAWDITVLFLMAGGTALSVTSVVIGWRRLRRKLRQTNILLET